MANCNNLFREFVKDITPTSDQLAKMANSRESLETKITKKVEETLGQKPTYFIQGSLAPKFKTIIIKEDGTYDVDRGVYLPVKPKISATDVQKLIYDAVDDHTEDGAQIRKKCIRVLYKGAYNIDLPVYYEVSDESYSYLATKDGDWVKDDPSKMLDWLADHKDENGQLIRIIRILKAWASKTNYKMPSGIAFAVWAAKFYIEDVDRDDKCLADILSSIKNAILITISCVSPVEPFDDFLDRMSITQKQQFKTALDVFEKDARKALNEKNQLKASLIWRKYLGDRFKEGEDEDVDEKERALLASAAKVLSNSAFLNSAGHINESTGVQHQPHRNYGG